MEQVDSVALSHICLHLTITITHSRARTLIITKLMVLFTYCVLPTNMFPLCVTYYIVIYCWCYHTLLSVLPTTLLVLPTTSVT